MYYILFYKTVDNYIEARLPYRDEHLKYANAAHEAGKLFMAGALAEPADSAVLIFHCNSPVAAEEFAKNDVYVRNGVVVEWYVRPWTVVIGDNG